MSVYVDDLMQCLRSARWPYSESCHMIADSDSELLEFAVRLGLKPQWIQRFPRRLTHFDLTKGKRAQAVAMGALEMNRDDFVARVRAARAADTVTPPPCPTT